MAFYQLPGYGITYNACTNNETGDRVLNWLHNIPFGFARSPSSSLSWRTSYAAPLIYLPLPELFNQQNYRQVIWLAICG
jgi:hypothetical protein